MNLNHADIQRLKIGLQRFFSREDRRVQCVAFFNESSFGHLKMALDCRVNELTAAVIGAGLVKECSNMFGQTGAPHVCQKMYEVKVA